MTTAVVDVLAETRPRASIWKRTERGAVRLLAKGFFHGTSAATKLLPSSRLGRHGVEVLRDIRYQETGLQEHLLDIYRPIRRQGALPVILYIHGGGFTMLSKETHWVFGLWFARQGYVVVNINYRLAPRYPFPAGAMDACAAYAWIQREISRYGGDPTRVAIAGESAGANLATVLAIAACSRRSEPWARAVFDLDRAPQAILPACGLLQVSDIARFSREGRVGAFVAQRMGDIATSYLGSRTGTDASIALADPLLILEREDKWERPLPAFFAPVGTADPVLHDTQRLGTALARLGVAHVESYYPRQPHAFHAFVQFRAARRCWKDMYAFLDAHFPARPALDQARPLAG